MTSALPSTTDVEADIGVSDFDKLCAAVGRMGSRDAILMAFDLLEIDGEDLRRCEWHLRRATLRSLLKRSGLGIRLSEHLDGGDGATCLRTPASSGLKALSPSAVTGRTGRGAKPIGSRSRTRPHRPRPG